MQAVTLSAAVGNSYQSLRELFELPPGSPSRIIDGELQCQGAGFTYRFQPRGAPRPSDTETGVQCAVGASRSFDLNSPWVLDQIWVKETVADAGSVAVFAGALE